MFSSRRFGDDQQPGHARLYDKRILRIQFQDDAFGQASDRRDPSALNATSHRVAIRSNEHRPPFNLDELQSIDNAVGAIPCDTSRHRLDFRQFWHWTAVLGEMSETCRNIRRIGKWTPVFHPNKGVFR
jgi:hypothetical protein